MQLVPNELRWSPPSRAEPLRAGYCSARAASSFARKHQRSIIEVLDRKFVCLRSDLGLLHAGDHLIIYETGDRKSAVGTATVVVTILLAALFTFSASIKLLGVAKSLEIRDHLGVSPLHWRRRAA